MIPDRQEPYGVVRLKSSSATDATDETNSGGTATTIGDRLPPIGAAIFGRSKVNHISAKKRNKITICVVKFIAIILTAALSATWMLAASVALLRPPSPLVVPPASVGSGDGRDLPSSLRRFVMGRPGEALRDSVRSLGRGKKDGRAREDAAATLLDEKTPRQMKRRDMGLAQIDRVEGEEAGRVATDQMASKAAAARSGSNRSDISTGDASTPLLVFTCARADYLRRTLTAVYEHHPANKHSEGAAHEKFVVGSPIIVSQDGNDASVMETIDEFRVKFGSVNVPLFRMEHEKKKRGHLRGNDAYKALSAHYGWALGRTFLGDAYKSQSGLASMLPPRRVIILEEDIDVAPDFFSYMSATAPLLDADESLLAVSAWNDNGKDGMVGDPRRLVRSDFFPGLGWMMSRRIWDDIGSKWPEGWWDDWIRSPEIRKGRHSIRPEISRTFHFGSQGGASSNQFGTHLQKIRLNDVDIKWEDEDLSYLNRDSFRESYYQRVMNAKPYNVENVPDGAIAKAKYSDVRLEYKSWHGFLRIAKMFKLMEEEKAGVPRSGFENIVDFRPSSSETGAGHLIFVSPSLQVLEKNLIQGRKLSLEEFSRFIRLDPKN